jgi:hypothetical protein
VLLTLFPPSFLGGVARTPKASIKAKKKPIGKNGVFQG